MPVKNDSQTASELAEAKGPTRAQVAKCVKRGNADGKPVAVKSAEILDWKAYDDHVVVVTTDGQKLRGELQ